MICDFVVVKIYYASELFVTANKLGQNGYGNFIARHFKIWSIVFVGSFAVVFRVIYNYGINFIYVLYVYIYMCRYFMLKICNCVFPFDYFQKLSYA